MLKFFALFLYAICVLITIESFITRSDAGKILVRGVKDGTIKLMEWVASNDAKDSLRGLPKLFSWTAMALLLGILLVGESVSKDTVKVMSFTFVGLVVAWTSFNWFFNFKKQLKELWFPLVFVSGSPWFLLFMERSGAIPIEASLYFKLLPVFSSLGFSFVNEYLLAAIFSCAAAVFFSIGFFIVLAVFLAIPASIFVALVMASKISAYFLDNRPSWLRDVLIGYYFFMTMYMAARSI